MIHDPFGGKIKDALFEDLLKALLREHEARKRSFILAMDAEKAGKVPEHQLGIQTALKHAMQHHADAERILNALADRTGQGRGLL